MSGRKFRFNIIDAVIVVILAIAVAVLAYVFIFSDDSEIEGEEHTVEYVIHVTSVNEMFKDAVSQGDRVTFERNRKLDLGTVSAPPEVLPAVRVSYDNETGKEVYPEVEGLVDMIITFRAPTILTEWGYCIDEEAYITVNNSNEFVIGDFLCVGVCTEVNVID